MGLYRISMREQVLAKLRGVVHNYSGGFEAKMSFNEARMVLGLPENELEPNNEMIEKAYKQLMRRNHPDKGKKQRMR